MKTKLYTNNIHQYLQCSDIIDFDNESVAQLADKLYSASNGETDFIRKAFEYVRDHISHVVLIYVPLFFLVRIQGRNRI